MCNSRPLSRLLTKSSDRPLSRCGPEVVVLSNPVDVATSSTTAELSVDTTGIDGVMSWVVTNSATQPSAAQIKLGLDHAGLPAAASGAKLVIAAITINVSAVGLLALNSYWAHFIHAPSVGNDSNIVSGDGFTTDI